MDVIKRAQASFNRSQVLSVTTFVLFSAWMISFPYEGKVLYALAEQNGIELGSWMQAALGFLIIGLLCGAFIRSVKSAKRVLLFSCSVCLIGSGAFFYASFPLWVISLLIISFFEGLWTATWGWFFKLCTPQELRIKTAAACLSLSAIIMIGVNIAATQTWPYIGLALDMLLLVGSLAAAVKLPLQSPSEAVSDKATENRTRSIAAPMILLCMFIIIVTINSGLMFSVVNPAFAHLSFLTVCYWAVPYILAIVIVSRLPKTVRQNYVLYAAIASLGLSFIAFITLGRSVWAYFIIDTLLLGACGVNDLFWWTILGSMLTDRPNPSMIMGIGLAANVGGVLIGELLAGFAAPYSSGIISSMIGLTVVCVSLLILPPLQKRLFASIKYGNALESPEIVQPVNQKSNEIDFPGAYGLTEREHQITLLLLKGYTRQLIVSELMISESTVKTHIRNIYIKMEVKSKTELIQKLKA